jgi:bifunctional non-homologous end joining protein LigD
VPRPPDRLATYRDKRDPTRTPEPVPAPVVARPAGRDDTFVIQEHHARRLHWDFRLERGGVLVSWAVPKGLPPDPARNHLAVHTEDHPLEYAAFEGEIPAGEYGGGRVTIWDRGTYETHKWRPDEVIVTLHGGRVRGRYALFQTDDANWLVHRMDPPSDPQWQPLPELIRPMLAAPGLLPRRDEDDDYAYEMKWDGIRAIVYVEGGRVRILSRNDRDVTAGYPELRPLGPALGATAVVLDGEIVAFDAEGRPNFGRLQQRMHVTAAAAVRRLATDVPVSFLAFDVLHLDGRSTLPLPYDDRRALLESLALAGPSWATPPAFVGDGAAAMQASAGSGLEGVVAKRRISAYEPGRRSRNWIKVKTLRTQEVVIGGWKPGEGRRAGGIGSLLLGVFTDRGLVYAGHVGTGFTAAMLDDLAARMRPLARKTSPFVDEVPRAFAREAQWVRPALVAEVAFGEWTRDGRLRHPTWRGLRPDKRPEQVTVEQPL